MADCLKSNLSVQEPTYCEDASGNIIPDTAMYSWMAVRAAGPNILKDTTLCGTTTILDTIDGCARPIWSAVEVSLVDPRPFAETPNQSPNVNHQINADKTQSFQVSLRYSQDNFNEGFPLGFVGTTAFLRSIAVENRLNKDLLVRGTLDISYSDNVDPNRAVAFVYAITSPTSTTLTTPFDSLPGSTSFSSIFTLPSRAIVQPLWNTPSATNNIEWNSINCLFEVVGCSPATNTSTITITGSGPG